MHGVTMTLQGSRGKLRVDYLHGRGEGKVESAALLEELWEDCAVVEGTKIGGIAPQLYDEYVIRMCIPAKRRPATWRAKRGRPVVARKEEYQLRYTVERSFAWLGNYRRLLIRWEHLSRVDQGFFTVAVLLISLRRLFPSTAVAAGGGRASPTWSRLEALL
jgi:transposase